MLRTTAVIAVVVVLIAGGTPPAVPRSQRLGRIQSQVR